MNDAFSGYDIVALRDRPQWLTRYTDYYHATWGLNRDLLQDCLQHSLDTESPLPRFYLLCRQDDLIGMYGLITNDFISRQDLYPWLCALYVDPAYRKQGLGGWLLEHGCWQAHQQGFAKLYLSTDHVGYYERYGWRYLAKGYHPDGSGRIYAHETITRLGEGHAAP